MKKYVDYDNIYSVKGLGQSSVRAYFLFRKVPFLCILLREKIIKKMVNRMVVLLIGGGSVLMDAVISKLTKNGHRVYLLTGQKNNRFSYKKVFEKYESTIITYKRRNFKSLLYTIINL